MKDTVTYPLSSIMDEDEESRIDQLERELAEVKEQLRLCNVDQFTTAAELAEAKAQRDKEIQKRKKICEAAVKLLKYLRPHLTHESQKLVDEADAAMKEGGE